MTSSITPILSSLPTSTWVDREQHSKSNCNKHPLIIEDMWVREKPSYSPPTYIKDYIYPYEEKWGREDGTLDLDSLDLRMFASINMEKLFLEKLHSEFMPEDIGYIEIFWDKLWNTLHHCGLSEGAYTQFEKLCHKYQKELPLEQLQQLLKDFGMNEEMIHPERSVKELIDCYLTSKEEGGNEMMTFSALKHYFTKFLQESSLNFKQTQLIQQVIDEVDTNIQRSQETLNLFVKSKLLDRFVIERYGWDEEIHKQYREIFDQWQEDAYIPTVKQVLEDIEEGKPSFFSVRWPGHALGARAFKQGEFYNIELANAGWGVDNQDPEISLSSSDGKIFVEYTTQDPKIFQTQLKNIFLISDALREDYFDLQDCYQALRDNMQENLKSISRPLQKVGNCYFRNILESIMRVIETQGERELVNDFYVFFEDKLKQKQVYPALQAQLNELSLPKFNHHVSPYEPIDLVA